MFSDLVNVVVAPLLLSIVTASTTSPVVLPQDASYTLKVSNQIVSDEFVSDPTVAGLVLAETDEQNTVSSSTSTTPLLLQVVRPFCVGKGGLLSYRIIITNTSDVISVYDVETVDTHPNMPVRNIQRKPDEEYEEETRQIVWKEAEIPPEQQVTYTFEVPRLKDRVENRVKVTFSTQEDASDQDEGEDNTGGESITYYELISDNCQPTPTGEIPPGFSYSPLPEDKAPAIICAPEETDCVEAIPKLGVNFGTARHYEYNPIFSRDDKAPLGIDIDSQENKPGLGVNFANATPEPHPGDCRVIGEDDIPGYAGLPAVQVTWCEAGEYPERLLKGAPTPVKAKFGSIRLPSTDSLPSPEPDSIDADAGVACRGLPGDPWWAEDCSCQCGNLILVPDAYETGAVVPCGGGDIPINRHDIFVTSEAECRNDLGHEDLVF